MEYSCVTSRSHSFKFSLQQTNKMIASPDIIIFSSTTLLLPLFFSIVHLLCSANLFLAFSTTNFYIDFEFRCSQQRSQEIDRLHQKNLRSYLRVRLNIFPFYVDLVLARWLYYLVQFFGVKIWRSELASLAVTVIAWWSLAHMVQIPECGLSNCSL
jgi:hypothetical protein